LGYNGFPRGVEDRATRLKNQDLKLEMIVHAEQNALRIAGRGAFAGTIYVSGKPVCARCAGLIIQAGIKRVVATNPNKVSKSSDWRETGIIAVQMLREAKVRVDFFRHRLS
jgi:dCMP deaminase